MLIPDDIDTIAKTTRINAPTKDAIFNQLKSDSAIILKF